MYGRKTAFRLGAIFLRRGSLGNVVGGFVFRDLLFGQLARLAHLRLPVRKMLLNCVDQLRFCLVKRCAVFSIVGTLFDPREGRIGIVDVEHGDCSFLKMARTASGMVDRKNGVQLDMNSEKITKS